MVDAEGRYEDPAGARWHPCANSALSACNWLAEERGGECFSCRLTRTRPNDDDARGLTQFAAAERSKSQLVAELDARGLPIVTRAEDPDGGLAFDLLSSAHEHVVSGHADGIITINLAESDDGYRERMRNQLDEPYRTMLGHFRHEVGHYFETVLVFNDEDATRRARALFGDDTADYQAAIDRHYGEGAPADWNERFISKYATMHPYEDFAESFAHYLHIWDTLDTAREYRLLPAGDADVLPGPGGQRMAAALDRAEPDQPQHGRSGPLPVCAVTGGAGQAGVRRRTVQVDGRLSRWSGGRPALARERPRA